MKKANSGEIPVDHSFSATAGAAPGRTFRTADTASSPGGGGGGAAMSVSPAPSDDVNAGIGLSPSRPIPEDAFGKKQKGTVTQDPELVAMVKIGRTLNELDDGTRLRVARWVRDKYVPD